MLLQQHAWYWNGFQQDSERKRTWTTQHNSVLINIQKYLTQYQPQTSRTYRLHCYCLQLSAVLIILMNLDSLKLLFFFATREQLLQSSIICYIELKFGFVITFCSVSIVILGPDCPYRESWDFKLFVSVYREYLSSEQYSIESRVWVRVLGNLEQETRSIIWGFMRVFENRLRFCNELFSVDGRPYTVYCRRCLRSSDWPVYKFRRLKSI